MSKYFRIAINTLQEYFVYRVNFFFWRLQVFISFIIFYSLWSAVSYGKTHLGVYSLPQLYSYFVIGYIIRALVFATRTADIGGDIQHGNLSILLLKPIGTIKYYFARDIIDKLFNLSFMIFEFFIILLIFRPTLVFPSSSNLLFFIILFLLSILIFFFYSLIISFIAFWTDSAWPPRFLFGVVFVTLFSGQYLPLDFLPKSLVNILNYTPYPYLYYYPIKAWLGQLSQPDLILSILYSLAMLILTAVIAQFMWLKGKKVFQSYGN
jgi:ABC-2 type transport system permease protein